MCLTIYHKCKLHVLLSIVCDANLIIIDLGAVRDLHYKLSCLSITLLHINLYIKLFKNCNIAYILETEIIFIVKELCIKM